MNKQIANILKGMVQDLSFIDQIAGLVQTIETTTKDENPKTIRFPASLDINGGNGEQYGDLVPNNTKKSISYFESWGFRFGAFTKDGIEGAATLRFVCWLNQNFEAGSEVMAANMVVNALHRPNPFNEGVFKRITIKPEAFLGLENDIFSRYTYEEKTLQYLMFPYSAFAIDLKVSFILGKECII